MKTRLLSLLVALFATTALWAYDFKSGDLYYNITSSTKPRTAEVTYQKSYSSDNYAGLTSAIIPATITYNGYTYSITSIGVVAFRGCTGLTSITIPDSVTSIGDGTFRGCTGLTSITIPNSVTSIGDYAFEDCTSLASITILNSDVSIGGNAFKNTAWYNNQPDGLIYIDNIVCGYKGTMPQGANIIINDGTKNIAGSAFKGCTDLTSVTIPNSVTSIGEAAFSGCTGLTSITIPNSVTSIGGAAFYGCTGLTSITIPNSVTSIGNYAFYGCTGLTSITIPDSVKSLGAYVFEGCTGLTSVSIGNSVTSIGGSAFSGCTGLTSVTIDNSITSIGDYAFKECTGLTSISIPNSVTSIGYGAFKGCTGLTSITIPDSVKSLGAYVFEGCTGLTSITIGNSVTSIYGSAFYGCTGLTSITIGNRVNSIGECFKDCTNLSSIVWNVISYKDCNPDETPFYDFYDGYDVRSPITSFTFGDDVKKIPDYLCYKMSNLESVEFGSNVQDIGSEAFSGCQNIYQMTVHATKVPNVVAESTFKGVSTSVELYVPAESVKKYKIHPVWGLFNVITAIPYIVTINCDNVMGAVTGAGSYQANEQVTITATPNAGYRFKQWSDGITTNPRTIVVVSDTTLTAEFEEIPTEEYTVSVVVNADQNGSVEMTLKAVPDDGYKFIQWSDGNTDNPRTILVTENMTLSATFQLSAETPTISADDAEGTAKIVKDGQVYILRGDKTYTITGDEVK